MARSAITSPSDGVDFLVSQHGQIKSLFAETLSAAGKEREKGFVELRRLRKIADGAAVVDARLREEHAAKTALQELEKLDVDSEEFTRKLTKLRDAVLDHAGHEERDEFARLGEQLSADEPGRMGRATKLAEAITTTRPHAGVESQVANLTAGPFAAMMDRARGAIVGKG